MIASLKLILESIVAIPRILSQIAEGIAALKNAQIDRDRQEWDLKLDSIIKNIEGAKTDEDRRRLVRDLNSLRVQR
jgi:hypothetical protein